MLGRAVTRSACRGMGIMTRALTAAACVSAPATSRFAGFPVVQVMPSLAPASRFFSADAASSSNVAAAAASAAAVASATPGAGAADGNSKGKGSDNTTMFNTKVHQPKMNPLPMLFALLMGIGGYIYLTQAERKQKTVSSTVTHQSGKIEIGGPFSGLVDQDGLPASSDQYAGQYTLIYFGFTHCPDICPTELQKMMRAINKIESRDGEVASLIKPIFISVDPLRDTPAKLKEHSKHYHPRIRWLTGPPDRLLDVAKKFRMYFSMPEDVTAEDDYNVDHSIFFFLMDTKGELLNYYGQNLNAEEIATSMTKIIKDDRRKINSGASEAAAQK